MNTDLLPTVLASPGIGAVATNDQIDGVSLWPALSGEPPDPSRVLNLFNKEDVAGLRTQPATPVVA